jgi:hypothetical protein
MKVLQFVSSFAGWYVFARTQTLVDFAHYVGGSQVSKIAVLHDAVENLIVAFHAINKQALKHALKNVLEIVERIDLGCRLQGLVSNGGFGYLIKKKLVRRLEIRSEALVELIDELRKHDGFVFITTRCRPPSGP